jgi:hypothetical protein
MRLPHRNRKSESISNTVNSNAGCEPETTTYDTSSRAQSTPVPVKGYPGEKAEGNTVKNPKTPETTKESSTKKLANKAAHKGVKEEKESEKSNAIFSK